MENKLEDSRIIDYLYGEMSDEEKLAFEKELKSNEGLKKKLESVSGVSEILGRLEDKEVVPPSFVFGNDKGSIESFWQSNPFRWVSSIAAGLTILLIAGSLLRFNISRNEEGLQISFGGQKNIQNELNKDDVQAWMNEALTKYDANTNNKIENLETKLTQKIDKQDDEYFTSMQEMLVRNSTETDQLMRSYISQVSDDNKKMIENFFVVSNDTQQKYMQSVLADFNEFYQNQRSYDLKVIETSIGLMKNNYDVQQLEQDNLLAGLYDIMQTQSK
ncbi:MAG: hypothetical protein JXR07_13460 [Reichenbachiella sp.]